MKTQRGLIHAVACCGDCAWFCENYQTAQRRAREHNKRTGHRVSVETGYIATYERSAGKEAGK